MSLEVVKGLLENVEPKFRASLSPRLNKFGEEEAKKLVTALDSGEKPTGYSPKEWVALNDVYLRVLEKVTASTPVETDVRVDSGWDMGKVHMGLVALPMREGAAFSLRLQDHPQAALQVEALATGRGEVCPTLMEHLPAGEARRAILAVLRKARIRE